MIYIFDIKINFENGVKIRSNFKSKIDLDKELLNNYIKFLNNNKFTKAIGELHDFRKYFKMCGRKLFFRVSLLKMHIRIERLYVVDRFYRPGGKGFEMCRDRFEQMNEIAVKKKM